MDRNVRETLTHVTEQERGMIDRRKVRLMTQLSVYEEREGREDLRLSRYYINDYTRFNVLKTAVAFTISYICLLGLVFVYNLEYLLDNALSVDYVSIGLMALGIYICLLALYIVGAALGYSGHYRRSRRKLAHYYRLLRKLRHMSGASEDTIVGTYGSRLSDDTFA